MDIKLFHRTFRLIIVLSIITLLMSCGGGGGGSNRQGEGEDNGESPIKFLSGNYELSSFSKIFNDGTTLTEDDYYDYYGRMVITTKGYIAVVCSLNNEEAKGFGGLCTGVENNVIQLYNDTDLITSNVEYEYDKDTLKLTYSEGNHGSDYKEIEIWKKISNFENDKDSPLIVDVIYYDNEGDQLYRTNSFHIGQKYYYQIFALELDHDIQTIYRKSFFPANSSKQYGDTDTSSMTVQKNDFIFIYPLDELIISEPAGDWRSDIQIRDSKRNYSNIYSIYYEVK